MWGTMNRKAITQALTAVILTTTIVGGLLLANSARQEEASSNLSAGEEAQRSNLYTYPISPPLGNGRIFIVTVETNWTSKPKVAVSPVSESSKSVSVVFLGWSRETVFFNITVPTDLLDGNLSVIQKYYLLPPERYTLSSNGTHNSVWMTCIFTPYFSGVGYFQIRETEAAS